MKVSELVNLDSDSFWKWWSGATKRNDKEEFMSILVEIQGGTKRRNNYSKAV